jgi:hypothetical protein
MKMMKKIKTLLMLTTLVIGLSVGIVGITPAVASWVPYSGAWYSTDGDSNFSDYTFFTEGIKQNFFLTDTNRANDLTVLTPGETGKTVFFTLSSGTWYASLTKGDINSALNLGSSGHFLYKYGNETNYDYWTLDPNKQYLLEFPTSTNNDGALIQANDVAPVPIPGAALLLASGML